MISLKTFYLNIIKLIIKRGNFSLNEPYTMGSEIRI